MALLQAWVLSVLADKELEPLLQALRREGYQVSRKPAQAAAAMRAAYDGCELLISDLTLESQSAAALCAQLQRKDPAIADHFEWAVLSRAMNIDSIGRHARSGIITFFSQPLASHETAQALQQLALRRKDPRREVGDLVSIMTGVQLDESKTTLIEKRLVKRLLDLGLNSPTDYIRYFRRNREKEIPLLVSQLTTHTTQFFRDTTHFDHLADQQLPDLIRARQPIRVWSAACSTGEEIYSIAIAIEETAKTLGIPNPQYEILGTDIDPHAVQVAQTGIYPSDSVSRIAPSLREQYFDLGTHEISHLCKVKESIWKHCKFRIFNLLSDNPPEGLFDAIFVRNVFIYFKPEEVTKIARRMSQSINAPGRLYIGASETLDCRSTGLKTVGGAIYAHSESARQLRFPTGTKEPARFYKVLIVDDSQTVRTVLKRILTPEYGFVVVGEAENPQIAQDFLKSHSVDVMTLDIHMPVMDGIEYLASIAGDLSHPPVVVVSSVNRDEAVSVLKCLELGAADYIEKPQGESLKTEAERIRATLTHVISNREGKPRQISPSAAPPLPSLTTYRPSERGRDLILIGASTGGIEAIRTLFARIPAETPPIVIAQHIPALFSRLFANRLNDISKVKVVEAEDSMILENNRAYIAPGGKHLGLRLSGGRLITYLSEAPPIHGCRPAVDFLFNSVAAAMEKGELRTAAAILTGMGRDGAEGLLNLRSKGAQTIAQDQESCIVYGMPKAAVEAGAVVLALPLQSIAHHLMEAFTREPHRRVAKGEAA